MDNKDYLQLAKDDLDYSHDWKRDYDDRTQAAAQAQAAALIAIAERLDDLSDVIFEIQKGIAAKR